MYLTCPKLLSTHVSCIRPVLLSRIDTLWKVFVFSYSKHYTRDVENQRLRCEYDRRGRKTVLDFRISPLESRNQSSFFPFLSIINNRTMKIIWTQNTVESSRRHRLTGEGADQMGPACRAMRPGMRGMAEESAASYRPCCLSHCCRGRGTAPNCGKGRKKDKGEKPPPIRTYIMAPAPAGYMSPRSSGAIPGAFTNFQMNEGDSLCTSVPLRNQSMALRSTRRYILHTAEQTIPTSFIQVLSDELYYAPGQIV